VTCFVYVIGSMTQHGYRTYVGWTLDLDRRLSEHNAGTGAKSTRGRCWKLIYAEKLETRVAAMSREWYLKRDRRLRRQLSLADLCNLDPSSTRGRFNDN
jgi:putative endonuclease